MIILRLQYIIIQRNDSGGIQEKNNAAGKEDDRSAGQSVRPPLKIFRYSAKLHDSSVVHSSGSACYINCEIEMCHGSQYPCDV